jgi:hypothetical protein
MLPHWHVNIESVLVYGISAIIVINLGRLGAAQLAKRDGRIGDVGRALGAVVA